MRHRLLMTAALVAAVALLLAGCREIEVQSRLDSKGGGSGKSGATAKSVQEVYVVQDGDTLYGIAERECGDGSSATAIARGRSSWASGTIGTTSAAPIRGCAPRWWRRSMRARASSMPVTMKPDLDLTEEVIKRYNWPNGVGVAKPAASSAAPAAPKASAAPPPPSPNF